MGLLRHSLAALVALLVLPFGLVALLLRPAWRAGLNGGLGRADTNTGLEGSLP